MNKITTEESLQISDNLKKDLSKLQNTIGTLSAQPFNPEFTKAIAKSVLSINAWKSLIDDIDEYIKEYSPLCADGSHDPKWCAMQEILMCIKTRLSEFINADIKIDRNNC